MNTYSKIAMVPRRPPSSSSAQNTPKVCIVKGTAIGMLIHEQMQITTAMRAIYAIFLVRISLSRFP